MTLTLVTIGFYPLGAIGIEYIETWLSFSCAVTNGYFYYIFVEKNKG